MWSTPVILLIILRQPKLVWWSKRTADCGWLVLAGMAGEVALYFGFGDARRDDFVVNLGLFHAKGMPSALY